MSVMPKVNPRPRLASTRPSLTFETLETVSPFENLPNEILTLILSFVPGKWVRNCALVCRAWRDAMSSCTFWQEKCRNTRRIRRFVENFVAPYYPKDWRDFYFKSPCSRNLIKNPSGKDGLTRGWIYENGCSKWWVETEDASTGKKPARLLAISDGSSHHFAALDGSLGRYQIIDLLAEGFSVSMLDKEQPDVVVSDWYATRSDFTNTFKFKVELLKQESSDHKAVITGFRFGPIHQPQGTPYKWQEVMTRFFKYGPGLRFIRFSEHTLSNRTSPGAMMAGSVVKLEFPNRICDWDVQ